MNNSTCVLLLAACWLLPINRLHSGSAALPGGEKRVIIKNTGSSVGTNRLSSPRSPSVSSFYTRSRSWSILLVHLDAEVNIRRKRPQAIPTTALCRKAVTVVCWDKAFFFFFTKEVMLLRWHVGKWRTVVKLWHQNVPSGSDIIQRVWSVLQAQEERSNFAAEGKTEKSLKLCFHRAAK